MCGSYVTSNCSGVTAPFRRGWDGTGRESKGQPTLASSVARSSTGSLVIDGTNKQTPERKACVPVPEPVPEPVPDKVLVIVRK